MPARARSAVAGVYLADDGYPNVKFRVRGLLASGGDSVAELCTPLPSAASRAGGRGARGLLQSLVYLGRVALGHLRVARRLVQDGPFDSVYVPYPAVALAALVSLLPRSRRPKAMHLDAFISLYDTLVHDRGLLTQNSPLARLVYALERRAYRAATTVLADTELTAAFMTRRFGLAEGTVRAVPLAIDEETYAPVPYRPTSRRPRAFFVGTFVPLQGVEVIARAIRLLDASQALEFELMGDGQTADAVQRILEGVPKDRVKWHRAWCRPRDVARAVANADICLGIFGASEKAQRVWPLKNYAYMSVGRALITADTEQTRAMVGDGEAPFATVPADDPRALADAILALARDPERRRAHAEAARRYYETHLRGAASLAQIIALMDPDEELSL